MKILLGIVIVLAMIIAGMMLFFRHFLRLLQRKNRSEERRLEGGSRQALILWHPSGHNSMRRVTDLAAKKLQEKGYTVTVNYVSDQLNYQPEEYDLLMFGTPVYMGQTSLPLQNYLKGHSFAGKQVVIYVCGMDTSKTDELDVLKEMVSPGSEATAVKVEKAHPEKIEEILEKALV
ncbi:hypothetical protein [Anaerolentibacter hominis]|uniref:flavodoxin family protein n=1 Tax=Anaerolentibacter hominis TaxID=3079009 RepID=UPI0031B88E51